MTLDELVKIAKKSESQYKESGLIRRYMQKFSKNAPIFKTWLALLPSSVFPYAAVAYGGIKILFDIAGRMHEGSKEVFKILSEIPDVIGNAEVYTKIYGSSRKVQKKCEKLYLVMIDVFEHSLKWLFKSPASI